MRNLTTAMSNAVAASTVTPILLFEATFGDATGYYWTGIGDLAWNGHTWLGVGTLIELAPFDETVDLQATGVSITTKAVASADVAAALADMRNGTAGSIRLALLDSAGAILADPKIVFRGRLDTAEIDDSDPENPVIKLQYENEMIDLERPREWRYTDEHQQQLHSGDTGLRYVAALQDQDVIWGRH